MANEIALKVGGKIYTGWKTASVSRGIESICGTFSLTVSEKFENESPSQAWPINEGDECSVTVNGETLITGYVDVFNPSYGAEDHSITISGRDKAADFVDSSANLDKWEFTNANVYKLAQKLAAPHGLSVSQLGITVPGKAVLAPGKLSISVGETSFNVLEQLCRLAGVLVISDGEGGLILTQPGTERATTELVEGQNILAASARFDASGRFATYQVLGQHAATDDFFGHEAAHVVASATDPNVSRANRVMILRPEGCVTTNYAQKRAQWEATVRAARSNTAQATVQGWTQADGSLWPVNAIVRVRSPRLRLNGEMLISQATYSVSDSEGTTTVLSLKPPSAFDPEPTVKPDAAWKELKGGV